MIGKNIEKFPELVSQLIKEGHEIGDHGYWHNHPCRSGLFKSIKDITRGYKTIKKYICIDKSILCRPPYGKFNFMTLIYILISQRQAVFLNMNPRDCSHDSADLISQYIIKRLFPGFVILFHDGKKSLPTDSDVIAKLLISIFEECENLGLDMVTASEALQE